MSSNLATASYGDDAPIAAFATVPGKSALTIIRCSGNGAIEIAASVFSAPERLTTAAGNSIVHGWIVSANEKIDEALVSVFRSPKSYSGEDSLEISCHGGMSAGRAVMQALHNAGFRDALPGEFSFRAFMNGKLDLTRSESVMELVSAKTETGRRGAINRLAGALETEINGIKTLLLEALSGAEIFLDYSEDEIGADADEAAGILPGQEQVRQALSRLKKLAASWQRERLYQEGILAVIAGRPNAGKSSLFNTLLREDRSIVTESPGTTRDWIEAWVSIEGIPVRLADTAGLRESLDPVEKLGVERSRELLDSAELILYLIDGTQGFTEEDKAFLAELRQGKTAHDVDCRPWEKPLLLLWNKADIAPLPAHAEYGAIAVSAKTGEGLAELGKAVASAAQAGTAAISQYADDSQRAGSAQNATLGSERQKNLVEAACAALEEALALASRSEPLDIISPLIREAVNSLGEITGEVSTADILEEMFSRFCVGK
jgi:tRNA modification GTPase